MEDMLDVDRWPYDPRRPPVGLDETSNQLLADPRPPLPVQPGAVPRQDDEYHREGVANRFLWGEPLANRRQVAGTDRRTKVDWAQVVKDLVDVHSPAAERIVLVLDNRNPHTPASRYEAFAPAEAKRIADKLEIPSTPKHGSWLNRAEIERSALSRQGLDRRIPSRAVLAKEVAAWERERNQAQVTVNWRFTTADVRSKLKHLSPSFQL